jgi:hypothetical protein
MAVRNRLLIRLLGFATLIVTVSLVPPAESAFHFWHVKEVFSSADGSVQFIEMFNSASNEHFLSGVKLRSNADGVIKEFTFPANAPSSATSNRHLLIATPGFATLSGAVTPNFTLDQSTTPLTLPFFNPNATNITITFLGSGDSMAFTGASLPKNGVHSLSDAGASGSPPGTPSISSTVNSPTNFAGLTGSINVASGPTGDYNGNHVVDAADYVSWRDRLNQTGLTPGSGPDGSNNGTVDLADFTFWRSKFGNAAPGAGSATSAPEPASGALFLLVLVSLRLARRHR